MEEAFTTLVNNMASFAQNVQIQTTATNERSVQLTDNLETLSGTVRNVAAQETRRTELKIGPPPYNGKGYFREWKRKLELLYEAKRLTDEEKLVWTLDFLQDVASRWPTTRDQIPTGN